MTDLLIHTIFNKFWTLWENKLYRIKRLLSSNTNLNDSNIH